LQALAPPVRLSASRSLFAREARSRTIPLAPSYSRVFGSGPRRRWRQWQSKSEEDACGYPPCWAGRKVYERWRNQKGRFSLL